MRDVIGAFTLGISVQREINNNAFWKGTTYSNIKTYLNQSESVRGLS